jgi:predicted adenylyl cyclase CyaB
MAEPKYEVEIKSLLGEAAKADALRANIAKLDPDAKLLNSYTQLNHYFEGGDAAVLADRLAPHLPSGIAEQMKQMAGGEKISLRTREMNGVTKIVMKASVGSDSSANGVARMEIEEPIEGMTFDQLDQEVLSAGYHYQAKWSRTREEYEVRGITVCLDKNAGYGYLVEFEKVIHELGKTDEAKHEIETLMRELGVSELPQERLERMFAYYNAHWPEYYGTDKVFTIE